MSDISGWRTLVFVCGGGGLAAYALAAFADLPDAITLPLAFLLGPLIGVALLATARLLQRSKPSALLEAAGLVGLAAGCMMLAMLAIQQGLFTATLPRGKTAEFADLRNAPVLVTRAVNDAQLSLDVAWDTLVCMSVAMMCLATIRRSLLAGIWCSLGLVISVGGWLLQLHTFPTPPADAGYFDFGPFLALWMAISGFTVAWPRHSAPATAS